jgi:integrase
MPKLTAASVDKYRPDKRGRREIPDGGCPSLRLVIQTSGHKSWAMRFRRPTGKSAKLTLGPVDISGSEQEGEPVIGQPLSLVAARRLAADIQRQRVMGRDVIADIAAAEHRRKFDAAKGATNTFAAAARDFVVEHCVKKTRNWKTTARNLGLDPRADFEVVPGGLADRWADKPVTTIDGHDIYSIVDETRRLGVPGRQRRSDGPTEGLARLMLRTLSKMFSWLIQHRRVDSNPCIGIKADKTKSRDRVLSDSEIAKFWAAADAERLGPLLKLLLLTGARLNEVSGMLRSELSEDRSTWSLPGTRTKNKKAYVVPMPPMARELIPTGKGDRIFSAAPGNTAKRRIDAKMKIPAWRFHDLRRTAVAGMANLGIRPDVIELVVNHASGSRAGVAGTYNRSELMPERRAALERWASHIEGLVSGRAASVVPMRITANKM